MDNKLNELKLEISKEQVARLPLATFPGRYVVINNLLDCRKAIKYLMTQKRLGFDTETRPAFKKGQHFKVALLQISTDTECFLFRVKNFGITEEIVALFENPDIMKIGLSVKDDIHQLSAIARFNPSNILELQSYVKQFGIADNSLQKVYAIIFGERISKGQRLSNWEAESLTEAQCAYASLDAYACLKMFNHLEQGNFNPAESPYRIEPGSARDDSAEAAICNQPAESAEGLSAVAVTSQKA